jgi:hemerythrin
MPQKKNIVSTDFIHSKEKYISTVNYPEPRKHRENHRFFCSAVFSLLESGLESDENASEGIRK